MKVTDADDEVRREQEEADLMERNWALLLTCLHQGR